MSFLALEDLIVARLEERVASHAWGDRKVPKVLVAADGADVEERSQFAPAYYVVFDNYEPVQEVNRGIVQQIAQHWVIFVVVRNAKKHASAQGVRDDGAVMADLALSALLGWKGHADFSPLYMAADTGPVYSDAGYGYFPLRFTTRCVVRGAE